MTTTDTEHGRTVDDIAEVLKFDPGTKRKDGPQGLDDTGPTSWHPVDLDDALSGAAPPPPVLLPRTDGIRLLYAGLTHVFLGESESCKTWGALLAAVDVFNDTDDTTGRVLWIDYEDNARTLVGRLLALGVDRDVIRGRLDYVNPTESVVVRGRDGVDKITPAGLDYVGLLNPGAYRLAVIDGVTEGMVVEGLDPVGTSDAAEFQQRLALKIARRTGAAVVSLDHVPKTAEGTTKRYALGSQHKISGQTGAAYIFEMVKMFHRAFGTEPVEGAVKVSVTKDRPGHVRPHALDSTLTVAPLAMMELTAYPDGGVTGRLVPLDQTRAGVDIRLMVKIADALNYEPGMSANGLENTVGGNRDALRHVVRDMVEKGYIERVKVGQAWRHTLTADGVDLLA